ILYLQYTNPAAFPSLAHSSGILAKRGWRGLFVGTGAASESDLMRFEPAENVSVRQIAFCPAGWRQKLHFLYFCLWALRWSVALRPSWIYASDPLSCPAAWLASIFSRDV